MAQECSNSACSKESCEGCPSRGGGAADFAAPMNENSRISHVIGIMSGKGGVGKSTVTALLALALRRRGCRVGILDADVTGPSIPHLFGIKEVPGILGEAMLPAESRSGIKIISVNLLLEDVSMPVIWRGPVLASVIKQFWTDVVWGELDYLLIDLPPGTGDVPLTVFQSLPLSGTVLVTSPQSLVGMVVEKALSMARMMNIPVKAAVENYSYLNCPDCGKKISVFGDGNTAAWAESRGIPYTLCMPMNPKLAALGDQGLIETWPGEELDGLIPFLNK